MPFEIACPDLYPQMTERIDGGGGRTSYQVYKSMIRGLKQIIVN